MKRLALTVLVLMLALPTGVALAQSIAHRNARHGSSPRSPESGKPVLDWNQTTALDREHAWGPARHDPADLELRDDARRDL